MTSHEGPISPVTVDETPASTASTHPKPTSSKSTGVSRTASGDAASAPLPLDPVAAKRAFVQLNALRSVSTGSIHSSSNAGLADELTVDSSSCADGEDGAGTGAAGGEHSSTSVTPTTAAQPLYATVTCPAAAVGVYPFRCAHHTYAHQQRQQQQQLAEKKTAGRSVTPPPSSVPGPWRWLSRSGPDECPECVAERARLQELRLSVAHEHCDPECLALGLCRLDTGSPKSVEEFHSKTLTDLWFEYTLSLTEVIYEAKIEAYEEACCELAIQAHTERRRALASQRQSRMPSAHPSAISSPTSQQQPGALPATKLGSWKGNSAGGLGRVAALLQVLPAVDTTTGGLAPPSPAAATEPPSTKSRGALDTASGTAFPSDADANAASRGAGGSNNNSINAGGDVASSVGASSQPVTPVGFVVSVPPSNCSARADDDDDDGDGDEDLEEETEEDRVLNTFMRQATLTKPAGNLAADVRFVDAIEEEKTYVYRGMEDGFTCGPEDTSAAERCAAWFNATPEAEEDCSRSNSRPSTASGAGDEDEGEGQALLYGELTTRGVRQLHYLTLKLTKEAQLLGCGNSLNTTAVSKSNNIPTSTNTNTNKPVSEDSGHGGQPDLASVGSDDGGVPHPLSSGFVVVGADIGSGTGKALFEWSRLAAAVSNSDNDYYGAAAMDIPVSSRQSSFAGPSSVPSVLRSFSALTNPAAAPAAAAAATAKRMPTPATTHPRGPGTVRGSPAFGQRHVFPTTRYGISPAAAVAAASPSTTEEGGGVAGSAPTSGPTPASLAAAAAASAESVTEQIFRSVGVPHFPPLRGWMGVGIELAPSRMRTARQALLPHYLDLRRVRITEDGTELGGESDADDTCGETTTTLGDDCAPDTSFRSARDGAAKVQTRYDPFPPKAIANFPRTPVAASCRQPAATVLLAEGDALAPGLLTNDTLFRFPTPQLSASLSSINASFTRRITTAARNNYYRLCRSDRSSPMLSGEDVHLNVFCCGLGFSARFVRRLCRRLEGLMRPYRLPAVSPVSQACPQFGDARPGCPWRSVTVVLLLATPHATLESPDFPLFRCCRRWHTELLSSDPPTNRGATPSSATTARSQSFSERSTPEWLRGPSGAPPVSADRYPTVLETSWMSEAPAHVLHFAF